MWLTEPYQSRIRSLDIETTGDRARRRLIKVIGLELSSLRSLKLLNEADQDPELMNGLYEEPPALDLPEIGMLKIQRAPVLERVELRDYLLPWTSPQLFARITHLELHTTVEEPDAFQPTYDEMRAVVAAMQSLETLILDDIFPLYPHMEPESSFPLPSTCREVVLRAAHSHFTLRPLVEAIALPSDCNLTINQVCRETDGAAEGDALFLLAGHDRRPQVASISTDPYETVCGECSVAYDASAYLKSPEKLLASTTIPAPCVTFLFEVATQTIEQENWDEEGSATVSYDRMQAAMKYVDLSDLRVLRLDGLREEDEEYLCNGTEDNGHRTAAVLAAAENLEILVVADYSLHVLMFFLNEPDRLSQRLIFPRLKTVVVPRDVKPYSVATLRGYIDARIKDGLGVPAVLAPQHLSDTEFVRDLGDNVVVTYY